RFHRSGAVMMLVGWLSFAAAWHDLCWSVVPARDLSRLATDRGVSVRVIAEVIEPAWIVTTPDNNSVPFWKPPERTLTTLNCREFEHEFCHERATGHVRLSLTGHYPELTCGDVVSVVGTLRLPAEPLNPGDFDYRTWLKGQGVRAILHVESAEAI